MSWKPQGIRKMIAFFAVMLIAAIKLDGPDLMQALVWSFAALAGGNGLEHFAKRGDRENYPRQEYIRGGE